MADARKARLVSGEIMATASAGDASARRAPRFDIVDAEFETVDRETGKSVTAVLPSAVPKPEPGATAGMDILRKRWEGRLAFGSVRGGPFFWTAGLALAAAAFWFSGGHALVLDASGPMQRAAQPLRIASVISRVDTSGGRVMLNIDGEAVNDGGKALPMPALDIQVMGNDDVTTRYNLGTSGSTIAPGERFAFASRLPAPKNGVKSVSVTFGR
jgi:hypothetical protein